jgi:cytochrome oxidase Cu insertion factor (SCO1/SenC/PrrC family)
MRPTLCLLAAGVVLSITLAAAQAPAPAPKIQTGPEVGSVLPNFEAPDQQGKTQTLATLTGPKGLMLVFFRSADW